MTIFSPNSGESSQELNQSTLFNLQQPFYAAFDGSFKDGEAGAGAVIINGTQPVIPLKARPPGEQTPATAEIHALYLVLENTPPNAPLIIFGDNLNTLSLLEGRSPTRVDERLIIRELNKRTAPITPIHIYSHADKKIERNPKKWKRLIEEQQRKLGIRYTMGKTMNEIADKLANEARELPLLTDEERAQFYIQNRTVYKINNVLTPDCPRKLLKIEYASSFPPSKIDYRREVYHSNRRPALYSFSIGLMYNVLPLNHKVFTGGSKLKRYESPYCKNCELKR